MVQVIEQYKLMNSRVARNLYLLLTLVDKLLTQISRNPNLATQILEKCF